MIIIKEEDFIAEGSSQKCYVHPEDINLCIKVITKDIKDTRLGYEINYIKKISNKKFRNLDYLFFSKHHKEIKTNLGTGHVYDLIRDEDTGKVSKTMADYLVDENSRLSDDTLYKNFKKLIELMVKHKVIANDLYSTNICCKILKDGSIQMIFIDGLGHKDNIPLVDWFSFFTRKKIDRRLTRHRFNNLNDQRQHLKDTNYVANNL